MVPNTSSPAPYADLDAAPPIELMQMLRMIWAGKWVIIGATLLALGLAGYYGFAVASPRYAAVAVLDLTPPASALPAADDMGVPPANPGTQIELLRATDTLQQVIDRLVLQDDPGFNRYLAPVPRWSLTGIRTILRNLLQGRSEPVPTAADIAAKLVQNLRAVIHIDNPRDSDLLRITVTTGDPAQAIRIANTLTQVYLADQSAQARASADTTNLWLTERSEDLHAAHSRIETAIADLTTTAGLQDPARHDTLARQLRDTENLLTSAQAGLARSTDSANRARLTGQIAALDNSRADLADKIQALGAAQSSLDALQIDLAANRSEQADRQSHLQAIALHSGQSPATARVLNAATEARYIGPQKILLLQIAAFVGALAGLMAVFLRHSLRRGFSDAQDLQRATNLAVLAQLPQLPSRKPARLLAALDTSGPSAVTESYRHLRTALLIQGQAAPQVILSTSAVPGEGKTTQAIGLAHALAALGKRVLLIDADLRQGSFARYFHLTGTDGLAAVILGHIDLVAAVEPSPIPGVDLLAGGGQDDTGAELVFSPALADVIAQARTLYDVVVIDAPPVLPVPDALALAQQADATVFAVRWQHTAAKVVLAATQKLAAAGLPVTGLTLTQIHSRRQAQQGGISFARYGRGYFHG